MRAIKPARTLWLSTGYANALPILKWSQSRAQSNHSWQMLATRHRALARVDRRPRGSCGTLHPTRHRSWREAHGGRTRHRSAFFTHG